jgi:hypothetical protein
MLIDKSIITSSLDPVSIYGGQRNALSCVLSSSPRRNSGSGTITGCKEVDGKRVKIPFILLPTYGPVHHVSKMVNTKVHARNPGKSAAFKFGYSE